MTQLKYLTPEEVEELLGSTYTEMQELAGVMYKKLEAGVESAELVTAEFDLGRTKLVARRRAAALSAIREMILDYWFETDKTPEDSDVLLRNIYRVQQHANG